MYQKATRILVFILLMLSTQAAFAQHKPGYQYMQLFYYGAKTMAGPVGHFSPALRGQTDIALTGPTAYMKQAMTQLVGVGEEIKGETSAAMTTSEGTFVDGRKLTPAELRQLNEKESKQQQQALESHMRMLSDHTKALTDRITQSLNLAAEDGWEVTQMSSFGTDGVVYLLRKAR